MKVLGNVTIGNGGSIQNASIATGPTFPSLPDAGELFYRAGAGANLDGLHVYDGTNWDPVGSFVNQNFNYYNSCVQYYGPESGMPSTGAVSSGAVYFATDSRKVYVSDGATWIAMVPNLDTVTITGDVSIPAGSSTATLANTTVTAGSYGASDQVGLFVVDSKGRLTAAENIDIALDAGTF